MIVTVLWEDQRGTQARGFGPHELLLSAVADILGLPRSTLLERIIASPKKGNGKVVRELRERLTKLEKSGPVVAVLDRDRIADLWKSRNDVLVPRCMSLQLEQIRKDAPGEYELVFLVENVETLTMAVLVAVGQAPTSKKPTPDERDRLLLRAAWDPQLRKQTLDAVPSFARLVGKVAHLVKASSE